MDRQPKRVVLIRHEVNQGVGGAIATGYKAALAERFDVTVVMAGDAQMDPDELPEIVGPVARGECDYTKGNRLFSGEAWDMIPRVRYLGNAILSLLTKIASGYWHVADSQSGYTAISLKALEPIDWHQMYKRYGQPNDLLVWLNVHGLRARGGPMCRQGTRQPQLRQPRRAHRICSVSCCSPEDSQRTAIGLDVRYLHGSCRSNLHAVP